MIWFCLFPICPIFPWCRWTWVYYWFEVIAVASTTAEVSTCDQVAGLLKGWLDDSSYSATGFKRPSVSTMLAGLLLHWHSLSCAVSFVSNHDIWMLSRNIQMLCCWIRQYTLTVCMMFSHFCAVCLHEFEIIVLNVARSLSWHFWQNTKHILDIPCHYWRSVTFCLGVFTTCLQCFGWFSHIVKCYFSVPANAMWFIQSELHSFLPQGDNRV